jgi:biotin transport system substrate-specific component
MTEKKIKPYDIVIIALMSALIAVCSFIAIPVGALPVTLQTFAVFACVGILGRKRGTVSVLVYVFLGIVGIPVFSGFQGGLSVLMGPTGGYIIGFLPAVFVSGSVLKKTGRKIPFMIASFVVGMTICYICGILWFVFVFSAGKSDLVSAFSVCVLPYIIPDIIKITLAAVVSTEIRKRIKL